MGGWASFKQWATNKVHGLVWIVVRSRFYQEVRKVVRKAVVPVAICSAGAGLGALAAYAFASPLWFGALLGLTVSGFSFIIFKACQDTRQRRSIMGTKRSGRSRRH